MKNTVSRTQAFAVPALLTAAALLSVFPVGAAYLVPALVAVLGMAAAALLMRGKVKCPHCGEKLPVWRTARGTNGRYCPACGSALRFAEDRPGPPGREPAPPERTRRIRADKVRSAVFFRRLGKCLFFVGLLVWSPLFLPGILIWCVAALPLGGVRCPYCEKTLWRRRFDPKNPGYCGNCGQKQEYL